MDANTVRTNTRWLAAALIAGFSLMFLTILPPAVATPTSSVADANSWTVYHGDAAGSGDAGSVTAVNTSSAAWTSPTFDGQLFGEPLVSSQYVYAATENDTVYALSAATGSVRWSKHLGVPVPASLLPCGDISPTVGITGTPVVDQTRNEIFVVADEVVNGKPAHLLVGLNATSGAIELTQNVDPPGAEPAALLQRTGLTLDAGQVVFAMGGNYGDCAPYRGRVVAVNEAGGVPSFFTVDAAAGDSQGAIWMGGAAPTVDREGHIWVSVGNGSVYSSTQPYDNSDSALELSSTLKLLQYFAPATWPHDNATDLDMSMAPVLLSDGQVLLAGKSRIIYLLNGARLGGIGGQEANLASTCGDDIDGGAAVIGTVIYLPCLSGVIAVSATDSPPTLRLLWSSGTGGGPPIVAAGLIWTISQTGSLYALDPSTGKVRQQASIGVPANHFPTPSVGDNLLLAPSAERILAYRATPETTATPTTTPTPSQITAPTRPSTSAVPSLTTTPSTVPKKQATGQTPAGGGGLGTGAVIGIVAGALLLLTAAAGLLWRRHRPGSANRPRGR